MSYELLYLLVDVCCSFFIFGLVYGLLYIVWDAGDKSSGVEFFF